MTTDLLGALTAVAVYAYAIGVFVARLAGKDRLEYVLGAMMLATAVPIVYLLFTAPGLERSALYYVQLGLMLVYLAVEFVLDYALQVDFRRVRWAVVLYVTLFFAATGGMIGVASHAGSGWTMAAVFLFLVMAALAFIQRAQTGQ